MMLINIVLFLMVVVVYCEIPLQIFAKLVVWVMLVNNLHMTGKALYNYVMPVSMAYAMPLHSVELAAQTRSTVFASTSTTRDGEGRRSGLKFDLSGVIENKSKRTISAVEVKCRWNFGLTEEGRTALITIPVNVVAGQVSRFSYTHKTRSDMDAPSDTSTFESRCHIVTLREMDQWNLAE